MNPDFQRGHVWTEEQQIAYVEYLLKGGMSGRTFYFNKPSWKNKDTINGYDDFVCVDGLQRTTAIEKFLNNAKANILFFRYAYYIKTNNQEMLRTLVFDDLKKSNNIPSLMNINWSLTPGSQTIDFENYSYTNYGYSLYRNMKLNTVSVLVRVQTATILHSGLWA
jgi:hypothetical protein